MSEPIKLPEAFRLADTPFALRDGRWNFDADDELRRLHAELATMTKRAEAAEGLSNHSLHAFDNCYEQAKRLARERDEARAEVERLREVLERAAECGLRDEIHAALKETK